MLSIGSCTTVIRPMLVVLLPLIVHGMLALTIVDSRHPRRRSSARAVALVFWMYLAAGTVWAASGHHPGHVAIWTVIVAQNSAGPLLLYGWCHSRALRD
ncbi:hypothetical protein LCL61_37115 [Amycolatopsis coloradensis]|uniref:Uncharacterized protein n=1 Tax=Amycolatopsis coloradensis TaxID=76021 RepID=A0ACD5BP30_9PSEU